MRKLGRHSSLYLPNIVPSGVEEAQIFGNGTSCFFEDNGDVLNHAKCLEFGPFNVSLSQGTDWVVNHKTWGAVILAIGGN